MRALRKRIVALSLTGIASAAIIGSPALSPVGAQVPTASPKADSAFFAGQWDKALPGYLTLSKADTTAVLWFRLGVTQHELTHYKDAVIALQRAARIGGFQPVAVRMRLARAYAMNGDRDLALAYVDSIGQLASAGIQPAALTSVTDFNSIRNDARFVATLKKIEAVRYPCRSQPEALQFDFWVGQWDVSPWSVPNAPPGAAGFNDVHPILENCVVYENWKGAGGGEGKSFNFYDSNLRKWRQIWMADGGGSLDYTGEFRDGAMRFAGWSLDPAGRRLEQKLTFTPVGRDTVRQTFEASSDSGKTWNVTFDGRYVRQKSKPGNE